VRVGDIIDATGPHADTLQFYSWERDSASGRFISMPVYLQGIKTDKGAVIGSKDLTGYTVFSPADSPATLRIPPVIAGTSGYAKKAVSRKTAAKGWAVLVNAVFPDGSRMSPVYCGFSPDGVNSVSYFPVPPSFSQTYVAVFDKTEKKLYGHALCRAMTDGGCSYMLAFVNESQDPQKVLYHLDNTSSLSKGLSALVYNEATGAYEDFSGGSAAVGIAAGGTEYRWLFVGSAPYLAKASAVIKTAKLDLMGIFPNPFGSLVRIRYSLPGAGVNSVSFSIFDMRGRVVWRKTVDDCGVSGTRDLVWNGSSLDRRHVASGVYVLRMTALGSKKELKGVFEKKMTYLP
jgi:hypothetical protein